MKIQTSKGLLELSQELFWDIELKQVTTVVEQNPHWVLPRVFEYGSVIEIDDTINFYGRKLSKKVLIEQKDELKPMTKAMAHVFLNIELRDYGAVEREF